jgi:hypothetical protein
MTFKEMVTEHYVSNGMFQKQAEEAFAVLEAEEAAADMKGRWGEPVDGYPPFMQSLIMVSADRAAIKWIDEHCPLAWYRPCFSQD